MCICVHCCGVVWVSEGWGLGGVVLRKTSLSRECVCVSVCWPHLCGCLQQRGVDFPVQR